MDCGCFHRNAHYALREMLAATNNPGTNNKYTCDTNCRHCAFLRTFCKYSMYSRYTTYHTVIGYRVYIQVQSKFFPHRLRMSVSYSEVGMNVPTFRRFCIFLRLRQLHKASNMPSPGEVAAGGHGNTRNKQKNSPRVKKRTAKRGECSDFHSDNHKNLHFIRIFIRQSFGERSPR